ncbi:MAG: Fe-S cluster assembly scaffold protein NifU [Clostridiaceae bacterium]|jgi:nitrogen fixation NifU-like protein|nr:Fe-S cluster assembly scaffold protein NifU [Clostridiaceae bacterium]
MYNEKVMATFQNPKNVGVIENPDGIGTVGNEACGDIMQISLRIEDGIIKDAKFKTFGCAAAIATSSVATEMVKGKTIEEALNLKNKEVVEYLEGLPPQKIHCSVLAEEAIKAAIENYKSKQA